MKATDLQTLARYAGGTLSGADGSSVLVTRVNTDSRKCAAGELFVALVGDKFDGHDFIAQAAKSGAAAVMVSKLPAGNLNCPVILVRDTLGGLQTLARNYLAAHKPFVIGITGSSGKTSTKDFICTVMAKKYQVCATAGNLNNHIGLPLSILSLSEGDTCGVFEMGMNHPGEIAPLAAIARPDAAVITNVGIAHIENMGSREAIALEKGMLAEAVQPQGLVVLNANDDYSPSISARCRARVIQAGLGAGDVSATNLRSSAEGTHFTLDFSGEKIETFLPVPGDHMVCNAALAAALGWQSGISAADAADALRDVSLTKGRLETKKVRDITFLDDSYNANPDSMKAGLKTLAGLRGNGRLVAVLGRMGELGSHATQSHREVGEYAAQLDLDAVLTVGDEACLIAEAAAAGNANTLARTFGTHADCADFLTSYLRAGDVVLLKGSRSSGMEKVLTHFQLS